MAPYGVTANCIMPSAATRLANIGWRMGRNAALRDTARLDTAMDPTDPVHVAEMICYLASPAAGWLSGQCFQVRGGIIEHVQTFVVDHVAERGDAGWTAADLVTELPRMFGAGARAADPPPKEWQDQYRAKGGASTSPGTGSRGT